MTRIIAGDARGRTIAVPTRGTRPTSDRVRESCFSTLESRWLDQGVSWSDIRVLDLFAGSGALGLEACSRGAASAVLVEKSRDAVRTITSNVSSLGFPSVSVLAMDARRLGALPASASTHLPANLVFADPPYEMSSADLSALLERACTNGWVKADATYVVERDVRSEGSPLPEFLDDVQQRTIGDTALWYGRRVVIEEVSD